MAFFQLWRVPLDRWHVLLLAVKSTRERVDPASVSRWAGFDLVHAWRVGDQADWDAVLDRHEGPWPDTLAGYDGTWSQSLRAHQLLTELDGIELSYEIGLASGGGVNRLAGQPHSARTAVADGRYEGGSPRPAGSVVPPGHCPVPAAQKTGSPLRSSWRGVACRGAGPPMKLPVWASVFLVLPRMGRVGAWWWWISRLALGRPRSGAGTRP